MSDFLTHLAVKATAPVPAIRPVVRSHYEPEAGVEFSDPVAPPAAAPRDFETPVIPQLRTVPAPAAKVAPVAGFVITEPARLPRTMAPLPLATSPANEPPPVIPHRPVPPESPESKPLEQLPLLQPAASPPHESAPDPLPPARHPAPSGPPTVVLAEPMTVRPAAERDPVLSNDPAPPSPPDRLPTVVDPVLLPKAPPASRPQVFPSPPKGSSDPQPLRPTAAEVPPPAPAVTITIGRVEIRAAAPAAQPSAPAPPAAGPPLNLETYLRRSASRSA